MNIHVNDAELRALLAWFCFRKASPQPPAEAMPVLAGLEPPAASSTAFSTAALAAENVACNRKPSSALR
jgi:hypothetical protein